ncbi:MAG TPA: N-acetyltransferase [Firmicutes bacterium]|nr:N-acetyltransferase [Bacillota bacterium]
MEKKEDARMCFETETERVYALDDDGRLVAEVTFPLDAAGVAEINHTFVDESLRGQGVAGRMMETAAAHLRAGGRRVRPVCSYAVRWFASHPEYGDLLAPDERI